MGTTSSRVRKNRRRRHPGAPVVQRLPVAALFRMFVIGSISVIAAAYALFRYYTVPPVPMRAPMPAPTEIPAPELELEPAAPASSPPSRPSP